MWPETVAATDILRSGRFVRWLERLGRFVYRSAPSITVVSPGYRRLLIAKGVPEEQGPFHPELGGRGDLPPRPERRRARGLPRPGRAVQRYLRREHRRGPSPGYAARGGGPAPRSPRCAVRADRRGRRGEAAPRPGGGAGTRQREVPRLAARAAHAGVFRAGRCRLHAPSPRPAVRDHRPGKDIRLPGLRTPDPLRGRRRRGGHRPGGGGRAWPARPRTPPPWPAPSGRSGRCPRPKGAPWAGTAAAPISRSTPAPPSSAGTRRSSSRPPARAGDSATGDGSLKNAGKKGRIAGDVNPV